MSFLTLREQVAPQGIGKPVRRREDARLLTGGGRFAMKRFSGVSCYARLHEDRYVPGASG